MIRRAAPWTKAKDMEQSCGMGHNNCALPGEWGSKPCRIIRELAVVKAGGWGAYLPMDPGLPVPMVAVDDPVVAAAEGRPDNPEGKLAL